MMSARVMLALALLSSFAAAEEFDSNGCKIHYLDVGKGEPVLLVHGMDSSAALNWQLPGTVDFLSKEYHVIAPDLRGHGKSDKPTKAEEYGTEIVEDLVRLLDHLKIERAHVAGYSMGGVIVMKLLVLHPDRVKSAVLGGMGFLRTGGVLEKVWENLDMKGLGGIGTPEPCLKSIGQLTSSEAEVKGVRVPTTIIVGEKDPCRLLYVKPLETIRPDWKVNTVPGAGHIDCIAKEEFKQQLKASLDANAARGK